MNILKKSIVRNFTKTMKVRALRNRLAEEVVREHIDELILGRSAPYSIRDRNIEKQVSLFTYHPIRNLSGIFKTTKEKGHIKDYRSEIVRLIKAVSEMSVTPDIALLLAIHVFEHSGKSRFLQTDKCSFRLALVEIKRGKTRLRRQQKEDVKRAEEAGFPYYLVRVDDSELVGGKFQLQCEQLLRGR